MGRLRASLTEVVGIRFDEKRTAERLIQLGIQDIATLNTLIEEMKKAHTREAFLKKIGSRGETNGD